MVVSLWRRSMPSLSLKPTSLSNSSKRMTFKFSRIYLPRNQRSCLILVTSWSFNCSLSTWKRSQSMASTSSDVSLILAWTKRPWFSRMRAQIKSVLCYWLRRIAPIRLANSMQHWRTSSRCSIRDSPCRSKRYASKSLASTRSHPRQMSMECPGSWRPAPPHSGSVKMIAQVLTHTSS